MVEAPGFAEQDQWQVQVQAEAADRELPLISAEFRPDLFAAQQALLEARNAAQASRREAMTRAVQARAGELRTVAAEIERLQGGVALLGKQREAVRELAARGLYPQLKVIQIERQYSDDTGSLAKAKASRSAAEAALAEARSRLEGLEIKPGASVELKPGSYHLMFMELKAPFAKDAKIPATLVFEKAGSVDVELSVAAMGTASPAMKH